MSLDKFLEAKRFKSQSEQLKFAVSLSLIDGYNLEFGVAHGATITLIARELFYNTIWGFDSFEGIPEPWVKGDGKERPAGKWKQEKLPKVPDNVNLIQGWFKDTIRIWKINYPNPISFIHIDCDLYSSTRTILFELNDQIIEDTIIVFDELLDGGRYLLWEEGEWKALKEWCEEKGREYSVLSTTQPKLESAAIIISK